MAVSVRISRWIVAIAVVLVLGPQSWAFAQKGSKISVAGGDKVRILEIIKGFRPYEEFEKELNALLAAK